MNLQYKMAEKVSKKIKYAMVLYHKINVRGVHLNRNFHAFFKKCTTFGLCRPPNNADHSKNYAPVLSDSTVVLFSRD